MLLGPMLTLEGLQRGKIPFSPHTNLGSVNGGGVKNSRESRDASAPTAGREEGLVNLHKELLSLPLMAYSALCSATLPTLVHYSLLCLDSAS